MGGLPGPPVERPQTAFYVSNLARNRDSGRKKTKKRYRYRRRWGDKGEGDRGKHPLLERLPRSTFGHMTRSLITRFPSIDMFFGFLPVRTPVSG